MFHSCLRGQRPAWSCEGSALPRVRVVWPGMAVGGRLGAAWGQPLLKVMMWKGNVSRTRSFPRGSSRTVNSAQSLQLSYLPLAACQLWVWVQALKSGCIIIPDISCSQWGSQVRVNLWRTLSTPVCWLKGDPRNDEAEVFKPPALTQILVWASSESLYVMWIFIFQRCSEFLEETECICAPVLSVTISARVGLGILKMGGDMSLGVKIFEKWEQLSSGETVMK